MGAKTTPTRRGPIGGSGRGHILGVGIGCVLLLAGCSGGSEGPAAVGDGSYRLWATSAGQDPDATVSLTITGDAVVLTQGPDTLESTLGQPVDSEYVLCPPDGMGSPLPLDAPIDVDGVRLARPALVGDCGQTRPERVTLVDLDSTTDQAFPFESWAEFCDTDDPDC